MRRKFSRNCQQVTTLYCATFENFVIESCLWKVICRYCRWTVKCRVIVMNSACWQFCLHLQNKFFVNYNGPYFCQRSRPLWVLLFSFCYRSNGSSDSCRSQSFGFVEDPTQLLSLSMYVFLITGSSLSSSKMSRCFYVSP